MTRMERVAGICLPRLLIGGLALDLSAQQPPVPLREPGKVLGLEPALAIVVGTMLLIVIVIGIVAMSPRGDESHESHPGHET
jgi:hypothetical protein